MAAAYVLQLERALRADGFGVLSVHDVVGGQMWEMVVTICLRAERRLWKMQEQQKKTSKNSSRGACETGAKG